MRQRKTRNVGPNSHKALRGLDDEQILAILRGTDNVTETAARFGTSVFVVSRIRRGLQKRARELMAEHGIKPWKKGAWTKNLHPRAPPKPKPPVFPTFEPVRVTPKPCRPDSLLTDDQVRQIMLTAGQVTAEAWAFQLGVNKSTIMKCRARESKRYIRIAMELGLIRKKPGVAFVELTKDELYGSEEQPYNPRGGRPKRNPDVGARA